MGGTPASSSWGGTPGRGVPTWGTPHHDLARGTPDRSGRGVPQQGGTRLGYPPPAWTGQHMEYLIRRGRYTSCVHAGGLSCFIVFGLFGQLRASLLLKIVHHGLCVWFDREQLSRHFVGQQVLLSPEAYLSLQKACTMIVIVIV